MAADGRFHTRSAGAVFKGTLRGTLGGKRGGCKLPDGVVRFVSSGLQVFADHVAEHQRHACRHAGAAPVLPVPVRPGPWR
jgi:hypothetical protein